MQAKSSQRRSAGTGSLFIRTDRVGRRTWYGKWREGERQIKRRLGPVREPGESVGLTRRQAQDALQKLVAEARSMRGAQISERITFAQAGERYLHHVEHFRGRKASTVQDYAIILRRHLAPFFAGRHLDAIDRTAVRAYQHAKLADGLSAKTVANHVRLLHGVFRHAVNEEWASRNPVAGIEHPDDRGRDVDTRALTLEELAALIRAVPDDRLGDVDRLLYMTAAMSGLRLGELQALRWMDIDFINPVVRVRRSLGRHGFTSPKSSRSVRAAPLAPELLESLAARWAATAAIDTDLVFAHPDTGGVYDASRIRKRYKAALAVAGLRDARFHDLRHTFGTRLAASGAPMRAIQAWMGHRDHATTLRYADHAPDPTGGARWAQRAFAADSGKIAPPAPAPAAPPDIVAPVTENEREAPTALIAADPPRAEGPPGEERTGGPDRFAAIPRADAAGRGPDEHRAIGAELRARRAPRP